MNKISAQPKGFTLLEVLVAITLTALVLGNLFALQSQSKRLSFKAQAAISTIIKQRSYLNAAWLSESQQDAYLTELSGSDYSISNTIALKKPEKQNKPLKYSLQSFTITDKNNEVVLSSVRMKESIVERQ